MARWKRRPRRGSTSRAREPRGYGPKPDAASLNKEFNKTATVGKKRSTRKPPTSPVPSVEFMFVILPMAPSGGKTRYMEQFKAKASAGKFYPSWAHVPAPKRPQFVVFRSTRVHEASGGSGCWQAPIPMFKSVDVGGGIEWVRIAPKRRPAPQFDGA